MREQQVDNIVRIIIGKHVNHEAIPAIRAGRFLDRQRYLNRKRGSDGIQRKHANRFIPGADATNLPGREVRHIV
ncbi:hypothetical protein D3C71_2169570 [compost metagenome]